MPSGILDADNRFPNLRSGGDVERRFGEVEDYLFLLLENLRYVLRNLGTENFNQTELIQIGENFAKDVSGPIYKRLEDAEGNIAEIIVRADLIATRMTNAEGDISTLEQTATSITSRVSDAEGNISVLQQTATGITSRVSSIEEDNGRIHTSISTLEQTAASITSRVASVETDNQNIHTSISSIEQTAASITTRVSSAEGRITGLDGSVDTLTSQVSTLEQTASDITARVETSEGDIASLQLTARDISSRVTSAEGNISTVTQTADKINWIIASGTSASNFTLTSKMASLVAAQIDLSGYVTISSLGSGGTTQIDGSRITTGTINAERLNADSVKVSKIYEERKFINPTISIGDGRISLGMSYQLGTSSTPLSTLYARAIYPGSENRLTLGDSSSRIGFFGQSGAYRQSVSSSADVSTLITALKAYGLIS